MHNQEPPRTFHFLTSLLHGLNQLQTFVQVVTNQFGNHFRVGLRIELNSFLIQLLPKLYIINDYPIMNDRHSFQMVKMRMGIDVIDLTTGSPSGMAYANSGLGMVPLSGCYQFFDAVNLTG
jgi:hypothetical protein